MENTRDRILKAATKLFAKHGLRRTSIRDIAQSAHVAKGALYYYFKNKEDVFATILQEELEDIWQKTRAAIESENDPSRKIFAYLTTVTTQMRQSILVHEAMNDDFLEHSQVLEKILKETRKKEVHILVEIISSGISKGLFEKVDAHQAAQTIVYAFEGLLGSPLIHEPDVLGDAKRAGLVFQLILDGLRKR